ncbi:hypothetical protein ONZ45_g10264 [Pleurotus djamor]|nr:hypothetical protein ONZ45_g10264 [Pleurotus djamor]
MRSAPLPLIFLFLLGQACAILRNVTIDDTFGDPETGGFITYDPGDAWNDGGACDACTAHPDNIDLLYDKTWKDSTFNTQPFSNGHGNTVLRASVSFNGIAVYVQCALALTKTSPTGDSDMTFFIDGEQAGTFVKEAPGTPGYEYKVIVFSATGLQPQQHTLTIANGHVDGPKALILLDAIIYTIVSVDDDQPNEPPPNEPLLGDAVSQTSVTVTKTMEAQASTSLSSSSSVLSADSTDSHPPSTTGPSRLASPSSAPERHPPSGGTSATPSTTDSPSSNGVGLVPGTSTPLSPGVIAAIVLGIVTIIILLILGSIFYKRRSKAKRSKPNTRLARHISPLMMEIPIPSPSVASSSPSSHLGPLLSTSPIRTLTMLDDVASQLHERSVSSDALSSPSRYSDGVLGIPPPPYDSGEGASAALPPPTDVIRLKHDDRIM